MAKTRIHEHEEALSVYFRDMLAEPFAEPQQTEVEPVADTSAAEPAEVVTAPISIPSGRQKLLLCEIGEMKLAVAVDALNNILHWPESGLNQLPGSADWQLGVLSQQREHTRVIDIRQFLDKDANADAPPAGYILLVDERRQGIACDRINQIVQIDSDDINWRRDRSQRPWFTGVIADSMHSIIDIGELLTAIEQQKMA
jgi:purine-binding chemotaxis protein CheW